MPPSVIMLWYVMSFCYFVHMCGADPVTFKSGGCLPSWIARRPSNSNTRSSPSWSTFFWGRGFLAQPHISDYHLLDEHDTSQGIQRHLHGRFWLFHMLTHPVCVSPDRTPMLDPWSFRKSGSGLQSQIVGQGPRVQDLSITSFISVCVAELPKIFIKLYQTWSFEPSMHSHHKLT